ncbi:MAG: aromatic amino acid hydroxylase [Deltaproteobacteria bacterium]|nr:aromatic amino acid hydroxylase [Deltaproteobacteria bacterium]
MSFEKLSSYQKLPEYLRSYVVEQNYAHYTAREHATWRYIMRNAREFFREHAHQVYLDGLEKSGIPVDRIPEIEEMDRVLNQFGWGALCVCGFIPPLAFLEFQSLKILPIAADMRTLEHIAYTPAPDIVHEAAGHAPILADRDYAEYLTRYANLARHAIFSAEDIRLYEAIRILSDTKENPDSGEDDIEKAESGLRTVISQMSWVSEAARVARMNWWTAEYGLVGEAECPKIYGAGLLSSLAESRSCLADSVQKIPLSLKCIEQTYDITKPQPQLYVARDFRQLTEVLEELESTMSFKKGGLYGLGVARQSRAVSSVVFDSGLTVSGVLESFQSVDDQLSFIRWSGPVQLSQGRTQLADHGSSRHPSGFSSPIGAWTYEPKIHPSELTDQQLAEAGLLPGKLAEIKTLAGFLICGRLLRIRRTDEGRLCLLTWDGCRVSRGDEDFFRPEWGEFDMLVASAVPSVYGGPADIDHYPERDFGRTSTNPGRQRPYDDAELKLFNLYQQLRDFRRSPLRGEALLAALEPLAQLLEAEYPQEWLALVELAELLRQKAGLDEMTVPWFSRLNHFLQGQDSGLDDLQRGFMKDGLLRAGTPD